MDPVEPPVRKYVDAIAAENRPLFDRIHDLILQVHPDATMALSYQIPTYRVGARRLFVGAWKHGISLYGWQEGRDAGFAVRHPELRTGKGTIQLQPAAAAAIPDDEFRKFLRAVLDS